MMYLTGDEIATTLILERQTDPRLCFIVEGEEECGLLDVHLDMRVAKTQLGKSKSAVLAAAEILLAAGYDWALSIVDADFDRVTHRADDWPSNVVGSEHYDLLTDAILSAPYILEGVAISHGHPGSIRDFESRVGMDLPQWILNAVRPVGILRWSVVSGTFDLSVRDWSFRGVHQVADYEGHRQLTAAEGERRSGFRISLQSISTEIGSLEANLPFDAADVYCGHDILAVLAELVRSVLGPQVGKRQIAASCRVAISCQEFQQLHVVRAMAHWAEHDHSVEIWKCA